MQTAIATTQANTAIVTGAGVQLENRENPAYVYLNSLGTAASRDGARRSLNSTARLILESAGVELEDDSTIEPWEMIPWHEMRYQDVAVVRRLLKERYKPHTANTHLARLRGVIRQSWLLEYLNVDEYQRIIDKSGAAQRVKGSTLPAGRMLKMGELNALIRVCAQDATPAGVRDAAIIGLMCYTAALRRSEVVSLDLQMWNPEDGELVITGKGQKERKGFVQNGSRAALEDWLHVRGNDDGPLFCPVNKAGHVVLRRMTSQAVYNMLKKRAEQAGISDFTPHDLRRTQLTEMIDSGIDLILVSRVAGHSSVATTAVYDRRGEEKTRSAVGQMHFPWARRYTE